MIDTLAAYEQSEYSYDALSPDTIHPGELGEELYLKAFTEVLSEKVAEVSTSVADYVSACATGEDLSLKNALPSHRHDIATPGDPRVEDYSTFIYYPLDEFVRLSDTAYELRDVSVAGIPGIFYWVVPGANDLKIYLNDELIMECAEDYQHYNLQTRIDNEKKLLAIKSDELEKMQLKEREKLEEVSGLSAEEAKNRLVESMKDEAKTAAASYINEIMDEAKLNANAQAKKIIIQTIQRVATETAIENSVSVFHIDNDEVKGRIIGREGQQEAL